ncbi:MAG: DUF4102 domain-containing protein [Gammaproteobacteria bacterium]|nr:DUF4102 domain-containing protein [Gammaproteobacteria bacterium]
MAEPDLGIRVTAKGVRSFVLRYMTRGCERQMTIGKHPDLNQTMARTNMRQIKGAVLEGRDPLLEREVERTAPTLDMAGTYNLAQYSADKRRALDLRAMHVIGPASGEGSKVVPLRAGRTLPVRSSDVA